MAIQVYESPRGGDQVARNRNISDARISYFAQPSRMGLARISIYAVIVLRPILAMPHRTGGKQGISKLVGNTVVRGSGTNKGRRRAARALFLPGTHRLGYFSSRVKPFVREKVPTARVMRRRHSPDSGAGGSFSMQALGRAL